LRQLLFFVPHHYVMRVCQPRNPDVLATIYDVTGWKTDYLAAWFPLALTRSIIKGIRLPLLLYTIQEFRICIDLA